MNITHETNQLEKETILYSLDGTRKLTDTKNMFTINRKFYFSSDLNLWQRLWDWIRGK